jgi:hypothetical protein
MKIYEIFDESLSESIGFYSTLEKAKEAVIQEVNKRPLNPEESRIFKFEFSIEEREVK